MVNLPQLKMEFKKHGYSVAEMARVLGISNGTMSTRMKTGNFTVQEVNKLARVLELSRLKMADIFFENFNNLEV